MTKVKVIFLSSLSACLVVLAFAQQPAAALPLSAADEQAIRQLLKDQETAWNRHDMVAFTKPLRDDAEGINVAGMYWSGKAAMTASHIVDASSTRRNRNDTSYHAVAMSRRTPKCSRPTVTHTSATATQRAARWSGSSSRRTGFTSATRRSIS